MNQERRKKTPDEVKAEQIRFLQRKSLEQKYRVRFTIAKEGKLALNRRDFRVMAYKFNEYLKILADTYEVKTIYDLKPSFFDLKKDVTELLLISQVYWELAKLYDQSSKSADKLDLCLKQFVLFTINMQFQALNSEIIRKELKRRKFKHLALFKKSLESIYKEAKSCYIATYCERSDRELDALRQLRNTWMETRTGLHFVDLYYRLSPTLVHHLRAWPLLSSPLKWTMNRIISSILFFKGSPR